MPKDLTEQLRELNDKAAGVSRSIEDLAKLIGVNPLSKEGNADPKEIYYQNLEKDGPQLAALKSLSVAMGKFGIPESEVRSMVSTTDGIIQLIVDTLSGRKD